MTANAPPPLPGEIAAALGVIRRAVIHEPRVVHLGYVFQFAKNTQPVVVGLCAIRTGQVTPDVFTQGEHHVTCLKCLGKIAKLRRRHGDDWLLRLK